MSLIMHIDVLTGNISNQHTHVKAGKDMRESMKLLIYACQMAQWSLLNTVRYAHFAVEQIPTKIIWQGTIYQSAMANPSRNQEGLT